MSDAETRFAESIASVVGDEPHALLAFGPAAEAALTHWEAIGLGGADPASAKVVLLVDGEEPAPPNNAVAAVRSNGTDPISRRSSLEAMGDLIAEALDAASPDAEARP